MASKQHNFVAAALIAGLVLALTGSFQLGARADVPGQHPHYLHALSDLREARGWLTVNEDNRTMNRDGEAVKNIDKTMEEVRQAGIDDGKNLDDHPPIDATLKHKGRLHKALDLVRSARKDLGFDEDDKKALGWRDQAIRHADKTVTLLKQAIKDSKDEI